MAKLKPPKPSAHPVDVGLRTEAAILGELVRLGYRVLVPFGVNQRYDLVIDMDGRFLRAQCKTGRLRNGVIEYRTVSIRSNTKGALTRSYRGDVELFLVYCPETSRIYAIPIEDAPSNRGYLRVSSTLNKQSDGVRWARDYELPA